MPVAAVNSGISFLAMSKWGCDGQLMTMVWPLSFDQSVPAACATYGNGNAVSADPIVALRAVRREIFIDSSRCPGYPQTVAFPVQLSQTFASAVF